MKVLALYLALAFSVTSHAVTQIEFNANPESPLIRISDRMDERANEVIRAPWFDANYQVRNLGSDAITLTGFSFTVTSVEGLRSDSSLELENSVRLEPGAKFELKHYLGELPISDSYSYRIDVDVKGWIGQVADKRTLSTLNFTTR